MVYHGSGNDMADDEMRPEYDLRKLKGHVRGKYVERYESLMAQTDLVGLRNSSEMQHILMNAMGDKDVQKKSE